MRYQIKQQVKSGIVIRFYSKPALSYLGSVKGLTAGGSGTRTENQPRQRKRRP